MNSELVMQVEPSDELEAKLEELEVRGRVIGGTCSLPTGKPTNYDEGHAGLKT